MRKIIATLCVVASFMTSAAAAPSTTTPQLSGKMIQLQYLVGTWACQTKIPAMNSMAAGTHKGMASFEIEPSNTIGYGISAAGYSASGYLGYSEKKQLWWNAGSDNLGGITSETGMSSPNNVNVMTGSSVMSGQTVATRDTITKANDTRYEDLYQLQKGATWVLGADSVCTKTSNIPD